MDQTLTGGQIKNLFRQIQNLFTELMDAHSQDESRNQPGPSIINIEQNCLEPEVNLTSDFQNTKDPCHMFNIKTQAEVEDKIQKEQLTTDLKNVKAMTLLDDEDIIYTLFMRSPSFGNKKYMFFSIYLRYYAKYKALIDQYKSIDIWLKFCLAILIYHDEEKLREVCQVPMSNLMLDSRFGLLKKSNQVNNYFPNKKIKTEKHPIKDLDLFKKQPKVFSIGKIVEYCVPCDFCTLFTTTSPGQVPVSIKGQFNGINGKFSKAVIGSVQLGKNKFVPHMDSLGELIASMSDLKTEPDIFFLEHKKNKTQLLHLPNEIEYKIITRIDNYHKELQMKEFNDSDHIVLTQFYCNATVAGTVSIKTFMDNIYRIDGKKLTDAEMDKIEEDNDAESEILAQKWNEYNKLSIHRQIYID